jgi:hypothetical protein
MEAMPPLSILASRLELGAPKLHFVESKKSPVGAAQKVAGLSARTIPVSSPLPESRVSRAVLQSWFVVA